MVYIVRLNGRPIGRVTASNDDDALVAAAQKFSILLDETVQVQRRSPEPDLRYLIQQAIA